MFCPYRNIGPNITTEIANGIYYTNARSSGGAGQEG